MSRYGDSESCIGTWMDGLQEDFPCNTIQVADGELRLSSVHAGTIGPEQVRDERAIPLANIRVRVGNRSGM